MALILEESGDVRFLIVDDVDHVQESLRAIIELEPGWQVAGTASGSRQAMQLARQLRPDIVLLDAELPRANIARLIRHLRHCAVRGVVVLTTYDTPAMAEQLAAAGVDLCIAKGEGVGLLQVLRDRYAVPSVVTGEARPGPVPVSAG